MQRRNWYTNLLSCSLDRNFDSPNVSNWVFNFNSSRDTNYLFLHKYQHNFSHQNHKGQTSGCSKNIVIKSIGSVPCLGISLFWRNHRTVFIFDSFSLFQLKILHKHSVDLLLERLNLKFFAELLDIKVINFVPCVGTMIVRESQDTPNIDQPLYWNSILSKTLFIYLFISYSCIYLFQLGRNQNILLYKEFWVQIDYQSCSCIGVVVVQNARLFDDSDSSRFSNSSFFS